jgi:DNA-binding transcriptional regulator YiaG
MGVKGDSLGGLAVPGQPYVGKLSDGRYFTVELPEGSAERDPVSNELVLQAPAIHLLDCLRTLLSPLPMSVTAGRLRLLRESLDWSPEELARNIQEEVVVVEGWEANHAKPTSEQRAKLEALRQRAARHGISLPLTASA